MPKKEIFGQPYGFLRDNDILKYLRGERSLPLLLRLQKEIINEIQDAVAKAADEIESLRNKQKL